MAKKKKVKAADVPAVAVAVEVKKKPPRKRNRRNKIGRQLASTPAQRYAAALRDPFAFVPPMVGDMEGANFIATIYDRRLVTLNTDGALLALSFPVASSTTSAYSALNIATPVTGNDGAAWSTANIVYSTLGGAATVRTNADAMYPLAGGMRLMPTGVMTGSSGVAFAGRSLIDDMLLTNTTPANLLTFNHQIHPANLPDGIQCLWSPSDPTTFTATGNSSAIGSGTVPETLWPGCCVGVLGGQNGQTVYLETVYHIVCSPNEGAACMFPEIEPELSTAEALQIAAQFARDVRGGVILSSKYSTIPYRYGAGARRRTRLPAASSSSCDAVLVDQDNSGYNIAERAATAAGALAVGAVANQLRRLRGV